MKKILNYLVFAMICLIPFGMAIAPAPLNIFMGLLIFSFLIKKIWKKEGSIIHTVINLPLLVLFILTCISVLHSPEWQDGLRGGILRLLQYIFVFLILVEEIRQRQQVKLIIFSIALGAVLVSLDAIWQVRSGFDFIRHYEPVINIGLVRAIASFKDSNILGIYLSALAPLIFPFALYYLKGKQRIISLILSIIVLAGIILTYSRPTLLAIYVVLFFLGIVKRDKLLVGVLLFLILLVPFIAPRPVKDWARQVEYNPLRFMCNDDRIAVYRNSLRMIQAHPFIGVGANAFMRSYKKYKEFPEYRGVVTLDEMKAHNMYLQMAGEIGFLGLGAFFWLLYRLFKQAGRIYRASSDRFLKIMTLSLVSCLIAFLVNGLTESSLHYSRVALLFWYLAGFLLALEKFSNAHAKNC